MDLKAVNLVEPVNTSCPEIPSDQVLFCHYPGLDMPHFDMKSGRKHYDEKLSP